MKLKWFLLSVGIAGAVASLIIDRFFHSTATTFFVYAAGGLILGAVPFDRDYERSRWARGLFALTAVLLLFISVSELLRHYRFWVLSSHLERGFAYTLAVLRGVVLGFLLSLMFSGQLIGRKVQSR